MEEFNARLGLRDSLELYLFLRKREPELDGAAGRLYAELRSFLYERLSIAEMESPETLLKKL